MPIIYKAVGNFRIDRLIVSIGDTYQGGSIDLLLSKGLIKGEESQEPIAKEVHEVLSEVSPTSILQEKKSKKKSKE